MTGRRPAAVRRGPGPSPTSATTSIPTWATAATPSLHTDVHLVYDAPSNLFLPGNHVVLTDHATQCLTDFSLDLERTSMLGADGPDLTVQSVTVNGEPASFRFVQPTYPGDPNGPDDPDPLAHAVVAGDPGRRPGPQPAAAGLLAPAHRRRRERAERRALPANKLVVTPAHPLRNRAVFQVSVAYTGRPGRPPRRRRLDRGLVPGQHQPPSDGSFVTTEPVGTEDWMPLNNHPSAKPTYDFYDTVNAGRTAIANGQLRPPRRTRPTRTSPAARPPSTGALGDARVANYLVENSVGAYDLTSRLGSDGVRYYQAQASALTDARKAQNKTVMDQQQDITDFQAQFNGPFPFTSDGVLVGIPNAGFEEEMQTMITFQGGRISLSTFHHENMHQWWGDHVSEASFNLTFFKEGMATLGQYLFSARNAQTNAGGPGTAAGDAAFEQSLVSRFNTNYANTGSLWTAAPSDPTPATLFSGSTTYTRPGTAYVALRRILGPERFNRALRRIQRTTAVPASPSPSSSESSPASCRTGATPASSGSASSSGSGSTPSTRPAAAPTARS